MERTGNQVKRAVISVMLRAALIILFVAQVARQQTATRSDFIIVEKIEHLVVYNRYQQPATDQERSVLTTFVPMKILKFDDFLGDGFTRCMRVEVNGRIFFLLKDSAGRLTHSGQLGLEKTLHNGFILLDSIEVLTHRPVRISPMNAPSRRLSAGEEVVRIFRNQNGTYCRTTTIPPVYGWVDLTTTQEGRDWKVCTASSVSLSMPASILQRVTAQVGRVNTLLVQLFDHFNAETHEQKHAPRWSVDTSGGAIFCTLQGTQHVEKFQQSTTYLAMNIENVALGTTLAVTRTPGRIEIRQR